ncbi:hypothetical protein MACJ_003707 [Theileria orientalis]|uniref:Single-strand binding protein n=1 Tax=Theileria orientalis TaxID=68886 RepID=A0A976SLI7_THEOR|nr:hypothetical protein MACJ_003707 [Theileria orientalis]
MILFLLFLPFCICVGLNLNNRKLFFIKSSISYNSLPNNHTKKVYQYDESFNDLVDDSNEQFNEQNLSDKQPPREHFDLSANTVTLCGRIGFIAEPHVFENGVKSLRLSIATSDRSRNGMIRTDWHKVVLYGVGNVDYIYSRARVGDRALAIGQLRYYQPQNSDGLNRAKVAEVCVNSTRGGHTFILMPKNPLTMEKTYEDNQQIYPDNY